MVKTFTRVTEMSAVLLGLDSMSSDSSLCFFSCHRGRPLAWILGRRPALEEEVGVLRHTCT